MLFDIQYDVFSGDKRSTGRTLAMSVIVLLWKLKLLLALEIFSDPANYAELNLFSQFLKLSICLQRQA